MEDQSELIKKLQNLDPLQLAEDALGGSYKEDEFIAFSGMQLQMMKSKMLNELMMATDDTKFSETTEEYLRKVLSIGFEVVYEEDFRAKKINEKFFILWHKEYSILLCFDTFHGSRNSSSMYYNWSPNEDARHLTSSGSVFSSYMDLETMTEKPNPEKCPKWNKEPWEEFRETQKAWSERNKAYVTENNLRMIWVGNHDAREAIKNNISLMVKNGIFLTKWVEKQNIYLSHHGDKHTMDDSNSLREMRYNALPDYIKNCIG